MKRILVPYDFSEIADHAATFAAEIAKASSADQLMLLYVLEHPSESRLKLMGATNMDPMEQVYITKLIGIVKDKLEGKISELAKIGINVTYKIQLGSPYRNLSLEVAEQDVELVIMGTGGAEGLDELFVGSNAEKVVRTAKCPVISVKGATHISDINDIVFASDFKNVKGDFVKQLKELQTIMGAELRIVKINTPATFTTTRFDMEQMDEFVKRFDLHNYTIDIYNATTEEVGIMHYAQDINADMIALGTSQKRGFSHFISGSIAEDIVNQASLPVWTMYMES